MNKKILVSFIALFLLVIAICYASDTLIIPGERISWIEVGMSFSAVRKSIGDGVTSMNEESITYIYNKYGLVISENLSGKIEMVIATDKRYKFSSGLRVGDSLSKAIEVYGKPTDYLDGVAHYPYKGFSLTITGASKIKDIIVFEPIRKKPRIPKI